MLFLQTSVTHIKLILCLHINWKKSTDYPYLCGSLKNQILKFCMKKSLLFTMALLASSLFVNGQVTTSSLSGSVQESSGAATVGASIKATHLPSGTVYTGTSNQSGRYSLANLRVGGPYKIEVTYVGQNPVVYEDIYLQLGQPFTLNIDFAGNGLSLGEVTISGNRNPLLSTDRQGTGTTVGRQEITNLPSITRSVNDLTRLTPQANGTSIGGGNYRANNFTLDGANFNNQFGIGQNIPAGGSPISIDAIEQIVVNVTPYDVRQSGFTGASVNAVTRSGRNEFFGSAFYTGRNDHMQGTRVRDKQVSFSEMSEKQYGVSLGGPIIKNKLFFFVNLEKNETVEPGPTKIASSPSNPIGSASNVARPSEEFMDMVSSYLRNTYGYETGPYQGYSNNSNQDKFFAKIDWNISNNHKINFRYNQVKGKSPSSLSNSFTGSGLSGLSRTGSNALHFANSNYFTENNLFSGVVEYTGRWGNTSNTLRFTYVNQNEPRSVGGGAFPLVDIKEAGNVITTFGYEPFSYGNLRDVETMTAYWDGNYTMGRHDFTYGAQFETSTTKNGFQRFGAGYYLFESWDDFVNGNRASNYVLTYPLTADGSQAFPAFQFNQVSAFIQDQISVNDRLKIMAGIRFEMPTIPSVDELQTHPLVAELTFADGLQLNTGETPKARLMVSPRVGFNYDVLGDRSLVMRGGTGIFTGRIPFVWIVAQSGDAGMLQATQVYTGNDVPAFSPDITANYPSTLPAAGTFIPSNISAMDKNLKFPSTWKSSLAFDYQLPYGILATVEGIYNSDINAVVAKNVNLVEPTAMNIPGYGDTRFMYPANPGDKYIHNLNSNGLVTSDATGAFSPTYMTNATGGHYYSVTFQLQKMFSNGFAGSIAYVNSGAKNYGDGSGDQIANLWGLPYNGSGNSNIPSLSYTNNVVPHRVTGYVSYSNNWIGNLKTSMNLFYTGGNTGRMSYYYSADFNRDGVSNDLIYIPANRSELQFAPIPANQLSNYGGNNYSPEEQADIFWNLVEGDDYLRSRKGTFAERNGGVMPWRHQFDFRFTQEIVNNIAGGKNGLEVFWDVFNIGNLLNSNWGVFKSSNSILLRPTNQNSLNPNGTTMPLFNIGYSNGDAVKSTTYVNETMSSTYYMQLGVRFSFN